MTATGGIETRAADAWRLVQREGAEPTRVDVVQARKERKIVCRLAAAGPARGDVIAKRCRLDTGRRERTIYDALLPAIGIRTLRCHGIIEEAADGRCWLFLEYAEGERYSPARDDHRQLAGDWLGLLHARGAGPALAALPERSAPYFLACLRQVRANIAASDADASLSRGSIAVLEGVVARLARLESRWPEVERLCAAMPETLVHGDFAPKNLRVVHEASGPALLCFDWGCAGRGHPAVDLAQAPASHRRLAASPDLERYWRVVRERWPGCELADVRRWAVVGSVFRALGALAWASRSIAVGAGEGRVAEMRLASRALARADAALPSAEVSR